MIGTIAPATSTDQAPPSESPPLATATAGQPPSRARLLKVVVQPVFVMDDGENLTEVTGAAVTVAPAEWRAFGQTSFGAEDLASIAAQYAAQQATQHQPPEQS